MFKHIPRYHLLPCLLLEFRLLVPEVFYSIDQEYWIIIYIYFIVLFFPYDCSSIRQKKSWNMSYDFWNFNTLFLIFLKTIACISTFAFLMTNSVFWLICILEQFGFGYYVAGTPVTVGVTMYVLSISSVSEVMMVLKNLCSKKICSHVFCFVLLAS